MNRYTGAVEPGLQHDEAQAALAATFSATAMQSPSARLDEASLALVGPASGAARRGQARRAAAAVAAGPRLLAARAPLHLAADLPLAVGAVLQLAGERGVAPGLALRAALPLRAGRTL